MPALQRTFPFAQVNQIAVMIADDLDLNMPRLLNHLLDINFARLEGPLRFARSIADSRFQFALRIHAPHPLAAAARGGLQQHRITNFPRQLARMLQIRGRLFAARHHRNIHLLRQSSCRGLRAQPPDGIGRRSNKHDPRSLARRRKLAILAQKSVAGMDRLGAVLPRRIQNPLNVQIAFHAFRLVRQPDMQRGAIDIRKNRDTRNIQLPQRPNHAHRNLSPIGNQHLPKHARRL